MGRAFGFITLLAVLCVGAYFYMHQTQTVLSGGSKNPHAVVDLIGVRNDLINIARAERSYSALHGSYVSLDELRSSGELTMAASGRGPYTYSVELGSSGFRAVATYGGPEGSGMPKTVSTDQDMQFNQE
jgi:hypothetical protein